MTSGTNSHGFRTLIVTLLRLTKIFTYHIHAYPDKWKMKIATVVIFIGNKPNYTALHTRYCLQYQSYKVHDNLTENMSCHSSSENTVYISPIIPASTKRLFLSYSQDTGCIKILISGNGWQTKQVRVDLACKTWS